MEAMVASGTAAEAAVEGAGQPPRAGPAHPDRPVVDAPEFGGRVRDTDKQPYWIPGAFPTIFQNETGDPYNAPMKEVDKLT